MSERTRKGPLKHLRVCQVCGSYMRPQSTIEQGAANQHWKHETQHRSFGGKELRKFVCEKCAHTDTFQIDDLEHLQEDD